MRRALIHHALAHLCAEKRNAGGFNEFLQSQPGLFAVSTCAQQHQRHAGRADHGHRFVEHHVVGHGIVPLAAGNDGRSGLFSGNVLRQLKQYRTGALFFSNSKGLTYQSGNVVAVDDLLAHFADGRKQIDHIDDLKLALLGLLDGLLPCDHDQRKCTQVGIGSGRGEVGGPRAQGGHAHAGTACESTIGGSHKTRPLFVAGQHQLDAAVAQAFNHVQVFFARYSEYVLYAFCFQGLNKKIGCFGALGRHGRSPFLGERPVSASWISISIPLSILGSRAHVLLK